MAVERMDAGASIEMNDKLRKRGMPFWKSALFSVLSATAVFLFWLFYPIKAPDESLQQYMPPECLAVLETHSPQKLAAGISASGVLENVHKLPLWHLVSNMVGRQTGENSEQLYAQLTSAVQGAAGALFGARNILAAAVGPIGTDGQEVAGILYLDNIGLTTAKLVLLFGGSGSKGGFRYLRIPAPGRQPTAFYLTVAPETRFLLIASNPQIFSRFRSLNTKPKGESFASLTTPEGATTGSGDTAMLLQVNADAGLIDSLLLSGQGRTIGLNSLKMRFYWNLLEFGGVGEAHFDKPFTTKALSGEGAYQIPDSLRGFALSAALSPELLALPMQFAGAAKNAGAHPKNLPTEGMYTKLLRGPALEFLANPKVSGFFNRSFLSSANGRLYAALSAKEGFGVLWGVTDPEQARKAFVTGLVKELDTIRKNENDLATQILLSAVKLDPTSDGAILRLPLVSADSSPYCVFGKNLTGGYGLVRQSRAHNFLPVKNLELPANVRMQAVMQWGHSPELITLLRQSASGIDSGLFGQILGESGTKKISDLLPQILQALDVLDSIEELSMQITQQNMPLQDGNQVSGVVRWECRARLRFIR